jgi:hypothetical protein
MTQQYIRGELSLRLEGLCRLEELRDGHLAAAELCALRELRRWVELAPTVELPRVAADAMDMVDAACWASLASGDLAAFDRECREGASLYEFVTCAGLLR